MSKNPYEIEEKIVKNLIESFKSKSKFLENEKFNLAKLKPFEYIQCYSIDRKTKHLTKGKQYRIIEIKNNKIALRNDFDQMKWIKIANKNKHWIDPKYNLRFRG